MAKHPHPGLLIHFLCAGFIAAMVLLSVQPVLAQGIGAAGAGAGGGGAGAGGGGGIQNPLQGQTFEGILVRFANWLLGLVAIISLIGIIMSGVRMIVAVGNDQAIASAKKILFWSVTGLIVAVLALAIVYTVANQILGVSRAYQLLVPTAHAVDIGLDTAIQTGLEPTTPQEIAVPVVLFITSLGALLSFAVFILGAVMMIISLGDDQRVALAKKVMLYAVVGLLLMGAAYVVVRFVGRLLGVLDS